MIRELKTRDYLNFLSYCQRYDKYKDFYIEDGTRKKYLFRRDTAKKIFNRVIKHADTCYVKLDGSEILGILLIIRENNKRYVKILSNSKKDSIDLFQYLSWHNHHNDLYLNAKKHNRYLVYFNKHRNILEPIDFLKKFKFRIINSDNNEVTMIKLNREITNGTNKLTK